MDFQCWKMADIWKTLNRVQYACSCGQFSALVNQYFCRHCLEVKCQECVFTLPEYPFCPHCFESAAGGDLKNKKYQCSHCFKCPLCESPLSVQQYLKTDEDKSQQEKDDSDGKSAKGYYLSCLFCQWTTREVGIPDGSSPLDFKEPEEASKARMKELCDHYKKMTLVDREEREKRRRASKKMMKPWSSMLDPAHSSKFASLTSPKSQVDTKLDPSAVSSEASSEVEPFPEDLYTTPVEIDTVTTIEQRLAYPSVQPTNVKDLWPRPFPLTAKRLRRCGKCDHMLCRAEYNPSSVRYKIQQIARLTVPQVKIRELPLPKPQEEYTFVLSITNPTSSVMKVSFEPEVSVDLPESRGGNLLKVMVPVGEFPISACDDVDVLDVSEDRSSLDPDQAKFLSGRGVGEIYLNFTTPPVQLDDDNQVMFTLNYSWSAADKSSEAKLLKAAVCVDLGKFLK